MKSTHHMSPMPLQSMMLLRTACTLACEQNKSNHCTLALEEDRPFVFALRIIFKCKKN